MSGSGLARRQARNHARYRGRNDINIVPMLDIFTILLFFLIFTAVFSRTHIIQLNLPPQNSAPLELPPTLELEVIVRKDALVVADRATGPLQTLPNAATGYDFPALSAYLSRVKSARPELRHAAVLLEPDTAYDTIVATMDAVRAVDVDDHGKHGQAELFPDTSLGDAPQ